MVENVEEANKANVKTQAGKYRALGLPVFPVNHDKVPLVPEWKYWQQQRQSEAEFQSLRWVGADSFGVPTGTKALNGYYFTAIDINTADFDLSILPKTRIEGPTPQKHGYHVLLFSRANTRGLKNLPAKLELLGLGNYVKMYPDLGMNSEDIAVVDDAAEIYQDLLNRTGTFERELLSVRDLLQGVGEGFRDNAGIRLASYYRQQEYSKDDVSQLLNEWNQKNNPPLPGSKIAEKVESAFRLPELKSSFEFIEFPDLAAVGFIPVQMKKSSRAYLDSRIIVKLHDASELFAHNAGVQWGTWEDMLTDYMRRYSFENADVQESVSGNLLNWYRLRGWRIKSTATVCPITCPRTLNVRWQKTS